MFVLNLLQEIAMVLTRRNVDDENGDQQTRLIKTNPQLKGEIPLYHRSGDKPLDPATLTDMVFHFFGTVWVHGPNH